MVRVHSEEALLEVLHEEQRHQQEAMAGRATSALRLLIQEDTCSEEGRRLVEALQAHDWIFCNPYFDCAQCLNGPLFSQRQVRG